MANLVATLKQFIRTTYQGRLDRNELRPSEYGALNLFRKQSRSPMSILTPEIHAAIQESFGNTIQIPVLNFEDITISVQRTCEVQTGGADTGLTTLVFFTVAFGFPMVPSRHEANDVSYQTYYLRNFEARRLKLLEFLDGKCVDWLDTKKNTYFPAGMVSYYPVSGGALQVSLAASKEFFNAVPSIMATADFMGSPDVLTNPMGMVYVRALEAQGENNAINSSYQIDNIGDFFQSNRVLNNAGVKSTEYLVGDGAVAIDSRVDPDCRRGRVIGAEASPEKMWTTMEVPGIGTMGYYFRADCSDQSTLLAAERMGYGKRVYVESHEWSADFVLMITYNSDGTTRYTPIIKAELLNA
jgi:hypothetical protein